MHHWHSCITVVKLVASIGVLWKLYLCRNCNTSSTNTMQGDLLGMLSLSLHEMAVSVLSVKSTRRKQLRSPSCHHLLQGRKHASGRPKMNIVNPELLAHIGFWLAALILLDKNGHRFTVVHSALRIHRQGWWKRSRHHYQHLQILSIKNTVLKNNKLGREGSSN